MRPPRSVAELKVRLLDALSIKERQLNRKIKKVMDDNLCSREEALGILSHINGISVNVVDGLNLDKIRQMLGSTKIQFAKETKISIEKVAGGGRDVDSMVRRAVKKFVGQKYPFLPNEISVGLGRILTSSAYICFLENSIRGYVREILSRSYGSDWWRAHRKKGVKDIDVIKAAIKAVVKNRKNEESIKKWLDKRGSHEIFYTDFGDLKDIILDNYELLGKVFPSRVFIESLLDQAEACRNINQHNNVLSDLAFNELINSCEKWREQVR